MNRADADAFAARITDKWPNLTVEVEQRWAVRVTDPMGFTAELDREIPLNEILLLGPVEHYNQREAVE